MESLNKKFKEKFYNFSLKKVLVVFLICYAAAILIHLKYRYIFWFNSGFFMFLIILISPVIIIIFIIIEILVKDRIRISLLILLIPIVCITGILGGEYISKYQAELSKEGIEPIIAAIEKYKIDNDKYPKELIQLVPKYLDNIPNSKMGWFDIPYDYELSAELSYKIKFPSADEEAWLYYGNSKGWHNVQD